MRVFTVFPSSWSLWSSRLSWWSFELVCEILKVHIFVNVFFILIRNFDLQSGDTKKLILMQGKTVWNKGRDPFNQIFWKFRSKTQWIGSVQLEIKVLKKLVHDPPFEVDPFSRSDRSEFWFNGSCPRAENIVSRSQISCLPSSGWSFFCSEDRKRNYNWAACPWAAQ